MSTYRRFQDGTTQRWQGGVFIDCPSDEPETRVRRADEGMFVLPAEKCVNDSPTIGIDDLLELLESDQAR